MANLQAKIPKGLTTLYFILLEIRPIHWIKNLSLFAAIIFTGQLLNLPLLTKVLLAFLSFNFASSATYTFNDILDVKADRAHPIKKNRPIAAGKVSIPVALFVVLILSLTSLNIAAKLNPLFFLSIAVYLGLQAAYSLKLKHLPIIDIIVIATGFIIRVYAGAFAINAHLSVWFLLCVISVALFLASGKRRAELGVSAGKSAVTRKSLARYSEPLLDSYVTMFGNAAWMSWAMFTFFESPSASLPVWIFLAELSRTTAISKLLMITIPVVIFGIMRYESLIFRGRSEAPEKVLLTDKYLVTSIVLWLGLVFFIIYGGVTVLV